MSTRREFLNMVANELPQVHEVFELVDVFYFVIVADKTRWNEVCADVFAHVGNWREQSNGYGAKIVAVSGVERLPVCARIWARDPLLWGQQLSKTDIGSIKRTAKQEMHVSVYDMQDKMKALQKRYLGAQMPEEAEIVGNAIYMLDSMREFLS